LAQFDFDQLREITRDAAGKLAPQRAGATEALRLEREPMHGRFDDDAWESLVEELRRFQDCRVWSPRPSHRRAIGPVVSFVKRAFFRLVRPLMHEAFETQASFNECAVELLSHLVDERRRMREELARSREGARSE
jgi:hypothetical protein